MPTQFLNGAERAIAVFFESLDQLARIHGPLDQQLEAEKLKSKEQDQDKGETDHLQGVHASVMTPRLQNEFVEFIKSLGEEHQLSFHIKLNSINGTSHIDNHLSFGPNMTTTLTRAPISVELAPMVYKRKYKSGYLLKEMNFEYYIADGDCNDESTPSLETRVAMTKDTVVVGIVMEANLDYEVQLEMNGESKYFEHFTKSVQFRFETDPFIGRDIGQFRIADVDNYFGSKLIPNNED